MTLRDLLGELLVDDPSRRKNALVRLIKSKDPRVAPYLEKVIERDPSSELRYLARKGLQFVGAQAPKTATSSAPLPEATEAQVLAALDHPDRGVRLKAVRWIRTKEKRDLVIHVARRLTLERDWGVQASLIEALGEFSDDRALKVLIPWLRHRDPRLRANTIEAIGKLESEIALTYLIPYLRDPDNRARGNAVLALRRSGRVNVFKTLEGMLKSPSASMQDSATFCLGQMGIGPQVFQLLEVALESPYAVTRNQVKAVLRRLGERGSGRAEALLARVGGEDEAEAVEELLESAAVEEVVKARYLSAAERAEGIFTRLSTLEVGEVATPEADRSQSVLAGLEALRGLVDPGEGDVDRRSREIEASLKRAVEAAAAAEPEAFQEEATLARLEALKGFSGDFVDPRGSRQEGLLQRLSSL